MSDPIGDLKRELLAAAERQRELAAVGEGRRRLRRDPRRSRLLLAVSTLGIAAAAALLVTAPWNHSPSFLARAQAALALKAGTVLHMKWEETTTSRDPACRITRGPNEMWIDQTPPHSYRALFMSTLPPDRERADPRVAACSSGTPIEFGGPLMGRTLMFVPPNTLTDSRAMFLLRPDPVAELRKAIRAGRAHDEGTTTLHGRTVERIRLDPPADCSESDCPRQPSYAYVDPDTFYLVETRGFGEIVDRKVVRLKVIDRYLTFEYLPRTDANLAHTDIRAQHPNATGP